MGLSVLMFLVAGCKGIKAKGETEVRQRTQPVGETFRPHGERPDVSTLTTNSSFENFLRFAMLNQSQVEAKYYDWRASVEQITIARSLPDPQITFESDIADVVQTVMPGFMQLFPGPGKTKAAARVATRESESRYFQFSSAVLQTAFDVKRTFYNLYFLDERIRINHETFRLLAGLETNARAQNEVGKATLLDVYRAQIE
jgi:outer membrane protein TolC